MLLQEPVGNAMLVTVLFWVLSLSGLTLGLTLGMRGDLWGFYSLVLSNFLVLSAFAVSMIARARSGNKGNKKK